jgi:addiction module HigA family antidote
MARTRSATGWNFKVATTHPGVMLLEEFLKPLGMSQNELALRIRVPATRIGEIVHGRRAVSPDTALRLARFFGNSPDFWLKLQKNSDLSKAMVERDVDVYRYA